jgi:hypothetical protein
MYVVEIRIALNKSRMEFSGGGLLDDGKEREGGREGRREGRKEGRKEEKSFSDVIISFHWGKGSAVSVRYRENTFLQFIQSRKTY